MPSYHPILRGGATYFFRFLLNLFLSLLTVESLMMAVSAAVPHFLAG